jgi:nitrite reductase/ring-hydroxylating ferredoxin subunit
MPVGLAGRERAGFAAVDGIAVTQAGCTHGAANPCDGCFGEHRAGCLCYRGWFDVQTGAAHAAPARLDRRMIARRARTGMAQVWP